MKKSSGLREEFKKNEADATWSNITISIQNLRFKVEYSYEDLKNSDISNYERHIIWRYNYLGIGLEQLNKRGKEILKKYLSGSKSLIRREEYVSGIYINDIKNIIDYDTQDYELYETETEAEDKKNKQPERIMQRKVKNQILLSEEEEQKNYKK